MQYSIPEINNGVAKVQWSDGSWTFVELTSDMTEDDLDDQVHRLIPPHLKTGASRTASEKTIANPVDDRPSWLVARVEAYGSVSSQLEYITENGLDAWQAKVTKIKTDNPKS